MTDASYLFGLTSWDVQSL